ncbi:aldo/keto reductase [Spirilliplanes yamanashiensis]|nr:aldo/keto reductase [Spirilliplanes yamanashiensis]MDP9817870.1 aryl-alcohol dehydrogenase-like predicted oxidoreductase [Spirilliplanes yamanashiensis]
MEYVRLGATGLKVSRICLGMMTYGSPAWRPWALDEAAAEPIVRQAVERGITFFDTADVYSQGASEKITGRLLAKLFGRRDYYVLATKVHGAMGGGPNDRGLSRKHILSGIDDSLRRLGTDHVDLYQIHRWDPETPIEETMEALHDVVRAGKARYIGASSMWTWQFAKAQHVAERHGWTRFVSMQPHYNLAYREEEREMLPYCLDSGVGVIPWSPLARGLLAGSRAAGTTRSRTDDFAKQLYGDDDLAVAEVVRKVAGDRGVPAAQVALAWLLHQDAVTAPIIGASKTGHIDDAVAAVDLRLSDDELAALAEPYRPHPVTGHS